MSLFIVKFGGSSLSTAEGRKRAIQIIKGYGEGGHRVVVVVSAIGRALDPYATDTLLQLLTEVNPSYLEKERDLLLSCGEIISAVLMTEGLRKEGLKASSFTGGQGGIITSPSGATTTIKEVYPQNLLKVINTGGIPVVAGFQGMTWEGQVTTLGRGGSDTTATALGAALKATRVDIYTDVEGLMNGDPRLIPWAKLLEEVTFQEACEMSYQGAQVIHSRAIEMAKRYHVPVRIQGTFSKGKGSIIYGEKRGEYPVTGLASRSDMVFFSLKDGQSSLDVFPILAEASVSLDFINLHPAGISFLVEKEKESLTQEILKGEAIMHEKRDDLVKISIIGGGMTGLPGVMATLVKGLQEINVHILQATDSLTTISCLIEKEREKDALLTLHRAFGLDKREESNHESR